MVNGAGRAGGGRGARGWANQEIEVSIKAIINFEFGVCARFNLHDVRALRSGPSESRPTMASAGKRGRTGRLAGNGRYCVI